MTFSNTIGAFTSFIMKAPFFYLLVTAMALMETVSSKDPPKPHLIIGNDKLGYRIVEDFACVKVEKGESIIYNTGDMQCDFHSDAACEDPVTPPFHSGDLNPIFLKTSQGYLSCGEYEYEFDRTG
ncbi:hypothetical protein [Absidia glauca]|uniref:Uncharacterized protein n=1 Tax=Absidia glauca TaxID=4829 RepID=A0A168KUZ0_ABSGL|nr:hypothetical protein [Absidia glauca]